MFCKSCGEKNDDGVRFCVKCGTAFQNPVMEEQAGKEYTAKHKIKIVVKNSILQIAIGLTVFMIIFKFTGLLDSLPGEAVVFIAIIGCVSLIVSNVVDYVVDEKKKSNRK